MQAEFIISAARPEQFPIEGLPEVAFLGRSNVGKSSLLNCLVSQKALAYTSARPGCTQTINFYKVDGKLHFVDLPGYGYAKVPKGFKDAWKELIDAYLSKRNSLELCFIVIDARRGWMEMDLELRDWLEFRGRPYEVVVTKTDKLKSQSERHRGLAALREQSGGRLPMPFSALTGQGVREIWQTIQIIKDRQAPRPPQT